MTVSALTVLLVYIFIAISNSLLVVVILKKKVFGHVWGAFIVALIGTFLGNIVYDFLHDVIYTFSNLFGLINIFPPVLGAIVSLVLYVYATNGKIK